MAKSINLTQHLRKNIVDAIMEPAHKAHYLKFAEQEHELAESFRRLGWGGFDPNAMRLQAAQVCWGSSVYVNGHTLKFSERSFEKPKKDSYIVDYARTLEIDWAYLPQDVREAAQRAGDMPIRSVYAVVRPVPASLSKRWSNVHVHTPGGEVHISTLRGKRFNELTSRLQDMVDARHNEHIDLYEKACKLYAFFKQFRTMSTLLKAWPEGEELIPARYQNPSAGTNLMVTPAAASLIVEELSKV